jgi:hypothetical protein
VPKQLARVWVGTSGVNRPSLPVLVEVAHQITASMCFVPALSK